MKKKKESIWFELSILTLMGFILGVMISDKYWSYISVSHQAAHYDSQTGHFTWNDEKGTK